MVARGKRATTEPMDENAADLDLTHKEFAGERPCKDTAGSLWLVLSNHY